MMYFKYITILFVNYASIKLEKINWMKNECMIQVVPLCPFLWDLGIGIKRLAVHSLDMIIF